LPGHIPWPHDRPGARRVGGNTLMFRTDLGPGLTFGGPRFPEFRGLVSRRSPGGPPVLGHQTSSMRSSRRHDRSALQNIRNGSPAPTPIMNSAVWCFGRIDPSQAASLLTRGILGAPRPEPRRQPRPAAGGSRLAPPDQGPPPASPDPDHKPKQMRRQTRIEFLIPSPSSRILWRCA